MLETSRLILRPFEERDYADVYEYTNRQTVHCFADMHFKSPEDARQEMLRRREDADFYFAICLKQTGRVIGEVFAHPEATAPGDAAADTFSPCWMLHPDCQGKGYAYEAVRAFFRLSIWGQRRAADLCLYRGRQPSIAKAVREARHAKGRVVPGICDLCKPAGRHAAV